MCQPFGVASRDRSSFLPAPTAIPCCPGAEPGDLAANGGGGRTPLEGSAGALGRCLPAARWRPRKFGARCASLFQSRGLLSFRTCQAPRAFLPHHSGDSGGGSQGRCGG